MGNPAALGGAAPVLLVAPSAQPANTKAPVATRAANLAECRTTPSFPRRRHTVTNVL
jgi:hypothetical protein